MRNFAALLAVLKICSAATVYASADTIYSKVFGVPAQPVPAISSVGDPAPKAILKVSFDCYVKTDLDCAMLEKAFFNADPYIEVAPPKTADVVVTVRAWHLPPTDDQYEIEFKGSSVVSPFKLSGPPLQLRDSLSSQATIALLLKHLIKGLGVFHDVYDYKISPEGKLVVTYESRGTAPIPPKKETPWYFTVGAGGNIASMGALDISVYAFTKFGYDTPTWLFETSGGGMYRYVSVEQEGETLSATNVRAGVDVLVARSVAAHWSVMAYVRGSYDPTSNWDTRTQAHTGVEYELIPFLESNDNAFTVSYIIGGNYENYVTPNIYGNAEQFLATHALSIYYVKHTSWADYSLSSAVTSLVDDPTKFALGAKAAVKFRITRSLTVDLSGEVGYKRNIINAPLNPPEMNPLLPVIGAGSAVAPFTYQLMMNLTYTWGNQLLRERDTRWKFMPTQLPINF